MIKSCRWCSQTENSYEAIRDHERTAHTTEYYLSYASKLEKEAEQLLEEAKYLREKFTKDSFGQE